MATTLARGPLTQALLDTLTASLGKPVGDGQAPAAGGWRGDPNAPTSKFVSYVVLIPLPAQNSSGSLGDSQSEWRLGYQLVSVGIRRDQVELISDRSRGLLDALRGQKLQLGDHRWGLQQVRTEVIGGLARNDATDPPYWTQADQVSLWLTKEHTP